MRAQKSFLMAVICLFLGFFATILLAQEAQEEFPAEGAGAGAELVVMSVSGPTTATHGQQTSVTYTVKNQGAVEAGAYQVDLYLSTKRTVDPAADRLLKNVTFSTGLEPGASKKITTKVLIPLTGLYGNYFYGAVVASSKKASLKRVSLARYSLGDDNDTVTDHKTGLAWQRADDAHSRKWADAKSYCEDLMLGGKADWRLPRIDELETIVDYSYFQYAPAIDPVFDARSEYYWSRTAFAPNPGHAWGVDFYAGVADWKESDKTYATHFVRCVRSGP